MATQTEMTQQKQRTTSMDSFDEPSAPDAAERKRSIRDGLETEDEKEAIPVQPETADHDEEAGHAEHSDHTKPEDWEPITIKGFRLHKYYVERPCSCYCCLCGAFWFWWIIFVICVSSFGSDFLYFTQEFPFWVQSHRSTEAQDGVIMMKKEATYSPGEAADTDGVPIRSEFESVAQVIYLAKDGQDMLSPSILKRVQEFEDKLLGEKKWSEEMCWMQGGVQCARKKSATLFWADDEANQGKEWFPKNYTRYPTFGNSYQYKTSYQSNNMEPVLKYDQDGIAEFWVNYGHPEFSTAKPLFSYFDTESCESQPSACRASAAGKNFSDEIFIDFVTGGLYWGYPTCKDMDALLNETYEARSQDPYFKDDNVENCGELLDWVQRRNLGCDDKFSNLGDTFPDATLRDLCCKTCFDQWYKEGDNTYKDLDGTEHTIYLNATECGLGLDSNRADVQEDDNTLLQICINQNKGTFTTDTSFDVTGTIDTADIEVKTYALLDEADIEYNIPIDVTESSNRVNIIVHYPWSTEAIKGQDFFQAETYANNLVAGIDDITKVSGLTCQRITVEGKPSVYEKTVEFNPLWDSVDGNYGVSSNMEEAKKASALRTVLPLGFPLDGYTSSSDNKDAQIEKLGEYCYEAWQDHLDEGVGGDIDIFWYCEGMEGPYTMAKLMFDAIRILGTIIFVGGFMVYVTGSYWLAFNGIGMLFLNFGPTLVIYSGIFGINFFGILQVMSLFLILSIGADDIFVILDTWGQANVKYWKTKNAEQRLSYTIRMSGNVMLTTSLSTIASFASNSFSVFPAIRTFGIFCAVLIAVNYCAVCIFYPAAMILHELFFQDAGTPCGKGCGTPLDSCCIFCNCWCRKCCGGDDGCCVGEKLVDRMNKKIEMGETVATGDEKRAIDEWFGGAYYQFVHKMRMIVIFLGLVIFVIFCAIGATISSDPNPPNIYPDGNNYKEWGTKFSETFTRHTSDLNVVAWITWGLTPPGIHRPKGHSDTDTEDFGDPTYDVMFNPFGTEEMEFLVAMCDDIESGNRYGDHIPRKVDETVTGGAYAVECPFKEFRDWIYRNDPSASYNLDGNAVNPDTTTVADADLVACIEKEIKSKNVSEHKAGVWPVEGFWQNYARWQDWMQDEMPVENPSYQRGKSNYAYFNAQLWYEKNAEWTGQKHNGEEYDWYCSQMVDKIIGTPKVMQVFVRLSVTNTYDFNDGIKLYEAWEQWVNNWVAGNAGQATTYVPTTTHCDGLSPINICEETSGCTWENSVCGPTTLDYPDKAPRGVQSIIVTDQGMFAYFFLQEQLLSECVFGIVLALFCAFLILNWATKNYIIATVATCTIAMIVMLVIGFTVALGWKLGILESIIYVMVVGMAVDYVVHLGEAYLEAAHVHHDRHSRSRDMLEVRGFSILSGAISTLGGIAILFSAFIIFFYKFAVIMFFLIAMSLWYSLVFFAAVMDSFGPSGDFGQWAHVYVDMEHVYNGDLTLLQCLQNCCVPHESEHHERHKVEPAPADDDVTADQGLRSIQ